VCEMLSHTLGVSFVVEDIPQDSFGPYSPQTC
jgi:hypothetical protein